MERPEDQSHLSVLSFCAELYEESERLASEVKMESWSILPEGRELKLRFFYGPTYDSYKSLDFFFIIIILQNRTQPEIESVTRFGRFGSGGGL